MEDREETEGGLDSSLCFHTVKTNGIHESHKVLIKMIQAYSSLSKNMILSDMICNRFLFSFSDNCS